MAQVKQPPIALNKLYKEIQDMQKRAKKIESMPDEEFYGKFFSFLKKIGDAVFADNKEMKSEVEEKRNAMIEQIKEVIKDIERQIEEMTNGKNDGEEIDEEAQDLNQENPDDRQVESQSNEKINEKPDNNLSQGEKNDSDNFFAKKYPKRDNNLKEKPQSFTKQQEEKRKEQEDLENQGR